MQRHYEGTDSARSIAWFWRSERDRKFETYPLRGATITHSGDLSQHQNPYKSAAFPSGIVSLAIKKAHLSALIPGALRGAWEASGADGHPLSHGKAEGGRNGPGRTSTRREQASAFSRGPLWRSADNGQHAQQAVSGRRLCQPSCSARMARHLLDGNERTRRQGESGQPILLHPVHRFAPIKMGA